MKVGKEWRAYNYSKKNFKLEVFSNEGRTIWLTPDLRSLIQGQIALAWRKGFESAQRDTK